eukprot:403340725
MMQSHQQHLLQNQILQQSYNFQHQISHHQESQATLAFSQSNNDDASPSCSYNPIETTPARYSNEKYNNNGLNINSAREYNPVNRNLENTDRYEGSTARKLQESDLVNVDMCGMYSDIKLQSSRKIKTGRKIEQNLDLTENNQMSDQKDQNQCNKLNDSEMNLNYDSVFSDQTNNQAHTSTSPNIQNTNHFQRKKNSQFTNATIASLTQQSPINFKRNLQIEDLHMNSNNPKKLNLISSKENESLNDDEDIESETLRIKQITQKSQESINQGKQVQGSFGFRRTSYVTEGTGKADTIIQKVITRNNSQKMSLTHKSTVQNSTFKNQHPVQQNSKVNNFTFCNQCNQSCQCQNGHPEFQEPINNTTSDLQSNLNKKLVSLKKMVYNPNNGSTQNMQIDTKINTHPSINIGPKTTQGLPPQNSQKHTLSSASSADNFAKSTKNQQSHMRNLPLNQKPNTNVSLPPSNMNSARSGSNLRNVNNTNNSLNSQQNSATTVSSRRKSSQSNVHEKNYIRNMLQNSVLSSSDDKIDFLVSEIETANTKISMLQDHLQNFMSSSNKPQVNQGHQKQLSQNFTNVANANQNILDTWIQEKKHYQQTVQNLINEQVAIKQENQLLKDENSQLRQLVTSRTEEANQTILKLMNQNQESKKKNEEYLVLIDQLSNEILKSNNQVQQLQNSNQLLQQQQQQMIGIIQQLNGQNQLTQRGTQPNSVSKDDYDRINQEKLQLQADLKAVSMRFDEMFKEKDMLEQQLLQQQMTNQDLQNQTAQKDETIKKLKKKIVSSFIKEKIWNNQNQNQEDFKSNTQNEEFSNIDNYLSAQTQNLQQDQHQFERTLKQQQNAGLFSPSSTIMSQFNDDQFGTLNSDTSLGVFSAHRAGNTETNQGKRFFNNTGDFSLTSGKQ